MFRRRWSWFGKTISDEGFNVWYQHKGVLYSDHDRTLSFGFEDGFLFPASAYDVRAKRRALLSQSELDAIVDRVISAIRWNGHTAKVYSPH